MACPFEPLGCKFKHRKDECDENDEMTKENNSDIDNTTPKASSSYEGNMEISSFFTSTPKSINCQECRDWSDCVDCIVRQTLGRHGVGPKLHFG